MTQNERQLFASRARPLGFGLFFMTIVVFFRAPLVPDIAREFEMSALLVGALSSAFALGRLVTDIPAGHASDRYPVGPMMALAALFIAVGSATMAVSPIVTLIFLGSFVLGVGSSWTLTTSIAFFATAPRERRGTSLSFFAAAMLVGQAMGPMVGGLLGAATDWRVTLGLGAVVVLLIGVFFYRMPTLRTEPRLDDRGDGEPDPRATPWALGVVYLLPGVQFAIGASLYQTLLPLIGDEDLGYSIALIGVALGLGGLSRFVGALVAGQISDRVSRKAALIPGLLLQLAGLFAFGWLGGPAGWWVSILFLTLGSVTVNVGSTILADLSESGGLGRRLGWFRFTGDAAFFIAPLVTGALFESSGRAMSMVPLMVMTVVVLIGSITVLPETRQR